MKKLLDISTKRKDRKLYLDHEMRGECGELRILQSHHDTWLFHISHGVCFLLMLQDPPRRRFLLRFATLCLSQNSSRLLNIMLLIEGGGNRRDWGNERNRTGFADKVCRFLSIMKTWRRRIDSLKYWMKFKTRQIFEVISIEWREIGKWESGNDVSNII